MKTSTLLSPRLRRGLAGSLLFLGLTPALALEFDYGDLGISLVNRVSLGAQWRIESRDPALISKLNLNPGLCAGDDCISFSGDPAPNQRLVDAPGAFYGDKQDDGNLNYDPGDLVAGVAKLTTDLSLSWGDIGLKARGIAFFDAINSDFAEYHPNNDTSAPAGAGGYQAEYTRRDGGAEGISGNSVELLDLVLSGFFFLGERGVSVSLGQQKLRWGEANLLALNSLNEINPPDVRRLRMPGGQINEVFKPVPLLAISGDVFPDLGITAEAFYQLRWEPVQADPGGTFFADVDPLYRTGPYSYGGINLGQFPEDPLVDDGSGRLRGQHRLQSPAAALLTDTSFSAPVDQSARARDDGQYGLRVNWFAEGINNGTEFGFYAMNYHSRLPYLSFFAADRNPMRDGSGTPFDVLSSCTLAGNDCLPIDTAAIALDYPEDIALYGLSFNTNVGSWSLAGEYSYRPAVPVQVHQADIFFAALQPALPEEDIVIGAAALGEAFAGLVNPLEAGFGDLAQAISGGSLDFPIIVPGRRSATPDYLESIYRGNNDVDANIAARGPNYYIPGFVELPVGQFAMTGIRIFGNSDFPASLLRAEQLILLAEVGFTHILELPPLSEVQFDVSSPNRTHASPGADGSGQVGGEPDARSLNPTQQTEAFVTDFSWGYRLLTFLEYNDVVWGLNFKPFALLAHDVSGYAPSPMANFLEGRIEWLAGTEIFYGEAWSAKLQYNGHAGDRHNSRRDRDNVLVEVSYTF